MEGKTITINCDKCNKPVVTLKMNTEYERHGWIYCASCVAELMEGR